MEDLSHMSKSKMFKIFLKLLVTDIQIMKSYSTACSYSWSSYYAIC